GQHSSTPRTQEVSVSVFSMSLSDFRPSIARFIGTRYPFDMFATVRVMFVLALMLFPRLSSAQWTARIGTQSDDHGRRGLAFLPNEIWIHAGDSITWTMATDEPHTVAFLTADQAVPPFTTGCPGFATGSAVFDGTACAATSLLFKGQTF